MKLIQKTFCLLVLLIMSSSLTFAGEPDYAALSSMIGENVSGTGLQSWVSGVGETPAIEKFKDSYSYEFKTKGIALYFDTKDVLRSINIYSEGTDGYLQYHGILPYGLSFLGNRNEVEKILGKPSPDDLVCVECISFCSVNYLSKGVQINYNADNPKDLNATIHSISIVQAVN